jgi:hypothetical protein
MSRGDSKQDTIDRARSLDSVPVLNEGLRVDETKENRVVVTVRLKRGKGLMSRFLPKEFNRQVKLDELGTYVFRQIDGETTTRQIINAFTKHYKVNRREAELSCVSFLRSLAARHVISVVVK